MELDDEACYRAFCTRDARFDGRLFSGCRTTGIYCRPVCPARTPRREHMMFFPTAAAAQAAGFRPCLRCRPEVAPRFAAWRGTSNTVGRAVSLIDRGALDEAGVPQLAARLGVGERHLRRLFQEHLGASPADVATTRRVLLAVQLIRDTRLSMADVALAAGFGSIRRFNEVFRHVFRRAPRALRRRPDGASHASAASSLGLVVNLPYRPPYDWPAMLSFLKARAIPGIERVSDQRYVRSIELNGSQGVIAVEPGAGCTLQVAVRFPHVAALPDIIERVRRLFDLCADPTAIDAHLATDSSMAPLVAARPGLRVPGAWDGFELAVRAILGQQVRLARAIGLLEKLGTSFGDLLTHQHDAAGGLTRVFPGPARLASADLSRFGLPRARATAVGALARAMTRDPNVLVAGDTLEDCVARLRSLPGVGEWTAQYIAMRELREPDAFPVGDVVLQRTVASLEGRALSAGQLLDRAERWRPWRAYAAQHLWMLGSRTPAQVRKEVA